MFPVPMTGPPRVSYLPLILWPIAEDTGYTVNPVLVGDGMGSSLVAYLIVIQRVTIKRGLSEAASQDRTSLKIHADFVIILNT